MDAFPTTTPIINNPSHLMAFADSSATDLGVITYWDAVSGPILDLAVAWEDAKLKGPHGKLPRPTPPCPATALRLACDQAADGRSTIVRRHPRAGVILIHESEGQEADQDPTYTPTLHVWLDKDELAFSRGDHPLVPVIRARYAVLRQTLTAKEAGSWLATVVRQLQGLGLRAAGGFYFVPSHQVDTWRRVVAMVRECAGITVYQIPACSTQGDALPAVLAAARTELAAQVAELAKESGGTMGDRARETRRARMCQIAEQVAMYEELCGTALEDLRTGLTQVSELLVVDAIQWAPLVGLDMGADLVLGGLG